MEVTTAAARAVITPDRDDYGELLLNEVRGFLTRFVQFPHAAAEVVCTLWAVHTHVTTRERWLAWGSTPRLAFLSKEPEAGKTRALEIMTLLVARGEMFTDPTAPAMAHLINTERATILIDEIDTLFGTGDGQRPMRALLNVGYHPRGRIARRREMVNVFAPVAMAGLGQTFESNPVLSPLRSRSIIIRMRSRRPGEEVDEFRQRDHGPQGDAIRDLIAKWAELHMLDLVTARPPMPEGVRDRTADIWEPLLAVADIAGGVWPVLARDACRQLALGRGEPMELELPPSARIQGDLRAVFFEAAQLPTSTIIERLFELPGAPWRVLWQDIAVAPRELAALLRPSGVTPVKIWADGRSLQGYKRLPDLAVPEGDQGPDQGPSGLPVVGAAA